jgi:hypothetical protein
MQVNSSVNFRLRRVYEVASEGYFYVKFVQSSTNGTSMSMHGGRGLPPVVHPEPEPDPEVGKNSELEKIEERTRNSEFEKNQESS